LTSASIAVFRTPEACADAVRAYFSWQAPVDDALPKLPDHDALAASAREAVTGGDATKLLDRLGIEQARRVDVSIGASEADVAAAVAGLKFPVAVKIVSTDIPHKTEAGGVLLNVVDIAALRTGLVQMRDTVTQRRPDARLEGFAIQEMRNGLGEVLVGYRVDPRIGPTIVVGVGGVLAEIYRDAVVALAPVSVDRAYAMINRLRGLAPLRGYRNLPEGDLPALAKTISAWSRLAQLPESGIAEAELNPLIIGRKGEGVVAVDVLLVPR
jgi:acyl-CoA synthetase (NDP forming)